MHSTENDSKRAVSLALNLSDAFDGLKWEKDGRQRMVQVNVDYFVVISEVWQLGYVVRFQTSHQTGDKNKWDYGLKR